MLVVFSALVLVHSFYSQSCCGGKDCRPVPCEQISRMSNGDWLWDNAYQRVTFFPGAMKVSEDDQCHVCVNDDTIPPMGICLYLAPRA
jgi:hypothetical protein